MKKLRFIPGTEILDIRAPSFEEAMAALAERAREGRRRQEQRELDAVVRLARSPLPPDPGKPEPASVASAAKKKRGGGLIVDYTQRRVLTASGEPLPATTFARVMAWQRDVESRRRPLRPTTAPARRRLVTRT